MSEVRQCPECGAELPADAPDEPCPVCLLKLGLVSWAEKAGEKSAGNPSATPLSAPGSFQAPLPEELTELFPQLEMLELLGQGGMGAVYRARQVSLDRTVALKIIKPDSADDPGFAERFAREAKALARLSHQNIVTVHDFGQVRSDPIHRVPQSEEDEVRRGSPTPPESVTEGLPNHAAAPETSGQRSGSVGDRPQPDSAAVGDGAQPLYYFIMEHVDGANLRQLLETQELKPEEALAIVPQICEALQYAHDEGIVHRDIKPENILVDKRGRVKIADFGLAKLLGGPPADVTLTGSHQVMGTPRYMAPEQMKGSRSVDHRADIYSLGVVFYEMRTGELPIGRFEPPSRKVQVDVRLDEVVLRSLESEPDRRYQHASEVKTDVDAISEAGKTQRKAHSRGTVGRAWDAWWAERDRWFTGAVLTVLLVAHLACMFAFVAPSSGMRFEDGQMSVTHRVGMPSPWFVYERSREKLAFTYSCGIHWLSFSMFVGAIGMLAWYVSWRIMLIKGERPGWMRFASPQVVFGFWTLAAAAIACVGTVKAHGRLERWEADLRGNAAASGDALHSAAAIGDASRVRGLLDQGADVNDKDANGETALIKAAAAGHASLCLALMLLGADAAEQDNLGKTAMMHAVENGHTGVLEALRRIEEIGRTRGFPIKSLKLDWRLLEEVDLRPRKFPIGANAQDANGETALMHAVLNGHQSSARGTKFARNAFRST